MVFCDNCGHRTDAVHKNTTRTVSCRGEEITVPYEGLFCSHCGKELYDEAVETSIFLKVKAAYRRRASLLPPESIKKLLKTISPEELAERIGCNANELIGAARGGIQSKDTDLALRAYIKRAA